MIDKRGLFAGLKTRVDQILAGNQRPEKKLEAVCVLLKDAVEHYDWVGFYLVDGDTRELVLGPYVGEVTEHVRIPFGKGICGQAAAVGGTIVIQDVSKVTNYLSCAPEVMSEIVVPIFVDGKIFGELDIDSHEVAPFSYEDREFLEYICRRVPEAIERGICPRQ